jgi:DNA-binding NarL/FixJ family response regulator
VIGIDVDASNWAWDIFENCLPVVTLSLLGLSGIGFLAVLFRRSETARERIVASEALLAQSTERFRSLFDNMAEGVALHELIFDAFGKPSNYRIVDMIMSPGIDGLETYRRVLENCPGQKAVITSGYSETSRVSEARRLGAGPYLKKPYTLENLGRAVKEELQRT